LLARIVGALKTRQDRVTRLGEFSLIGRLFGQRFEDFKRWPNFLATFVFNIDIFWATFFLNIYIFGQLFY
jgi:hypothetical protein